MQGSFEGIQQSSSKNGIVGIWYVHNIKDYVFCARVLGGTKGNMQCYHTNQLDSFIAEAIEGLRQFFELVFVVSHLLEGR
jgi:hypothetical protein